MRQIYARVTGGKFTGITYTEDELLFNGTLNAILSTGALVVPVIDDLDLTADTLRLPTDEELQAYIVTESDFSKPIYERDLRTEDTDVDVMVDARTLQFSPYRSDRTYRVGETCSIWESGKLRYFELQGISDTTMTGKTPALTANRIENTTSNEAYWEYYSQDKRDITYISNCQHNNLMMIMNGELYTASGNSDSNSNAGTGRGLDNAHPPYGLDFLSKVNFDFSGTTEDERTIVECGGNGYSFNYCLFANGDLHTWGNNTNGQCGAGHTSAIGVPIKVMENVSEVYAINYDSYSVINNAVFIKLTNGDIYCCGQNNEYECGLVDEDGNGITTQFSVFTHVSSLSNIKRIWNFTGYAGFSIAESNDPTQPLKAVGWNGKGQLGFGNTTNLKVWTEMPQWGYGEILNIIKTGVYYTSSEYPYTSLSILMYNSDTDMMTLRAAGNNSWGELGKGDKTASTVPVTLLSESKESSTYEFGSLNALSLYYLKNNILYTWGNNEGGCLGQGYSGGQVLVPTLTDFGTTEVEIITPNLDSHGYGYRNPMYAKLLSDYGTGVVGNLYAWGYGSGGQMGQGHLDTNNPSPTKIVLDEEIKMMGTYATKTHGRTIVAITATNRMYAWGYGLNESMINNQGDNILYPTEIKLPSVN